MILDDIIKHKRTEVEQARKTRPINDLEEQAAKRPVPRGFKRALVAGGGIKLIAEVKKASPSKGVIREDFQPLELARSFVQAGASAISVLTENKFFQGHLDYLSRIADIVKVPLLRKDFVVDEYQLVETRAAGADAVLLLASVLSVDQLRYFIDFSRSYGLDTLVEVHTEEELEKALAAEAEIIGINNRNLKTFKVDIKNTGKIISGIPAGKVIVSESGIFTREDMVYLQSLGVQAALIGEAIMREPHVEMKIKELLHG